VTSPPISIEGSNYFIYGLKIASAGLSGQKKLFRYDVMIETEITYQYSFLVNCVALENKGTTIAAYGSDSNS